MKPIVIALVLLAIPGIGIAAPVLNFSDLISGPNNGLGDGLGQGAIVTIWGNGLGDSQGTSTLTIGGQAPAYIYYWKNADGVLPGGPADLFTKHRMQEVAFSIPSALPDGQHAIVVTVNGGTSNELPFTVRAGNMYHAKTTGSSGAAGTFADPVSSIYDGGLGKLSVGDILYLHDGVADTNTYGTTGVLISGKIASVSHQYAIVAYPGAHYTITGSSVGVNFYNSAGWVLAKFKVLSGYHNEPDPASTVILDNNLSNGRGLEGCRNGRLVGNEITEIPGKCSSGYSGAITASAGGGSFDPIGNLKVFGNYIHDWGCNQTSHFEHTTYFSVRNGGFTDVDPWEIGWNYLRDNKAKYGIHNYDETHAAGADLCGSPTGVVKIHHNFVENQKGAGINIGSKAATDYDCWDSGGFDIFNNVVVESGKGPADENGYDNHGIRIGDAGMSSPVRVYNNTVVGWGDNALGAGAGVAGYNTMNSGRTPITVTNNIFYDTRSGQYTSFPGTTGLLLSGEVNLFYSAADGNSIDAALSRSIQSDPLFASAADYRITAMSPAIDSGVAGICNIDLIGARYPTGSGTDIGAYEYTDGETPPDTTPPVRNFGQPSGELPAGTTSVVGGLVTQENATCRWAETPGVVYAAMTNTFATTGGTLHSQMVSGLTGGCYTCYVRCIDGAGNANADDYLISWSVAEEGEPNPTCSDGFPWELFMPAIGDRPKTSTSVQ